MILNDRDLTEGVRLTTVALTMGEELGVDDKRATCLMMIGVAHVFGGNLDEGINEIEQAVELQRQQGLPGVVPGLSNLALSKKIFGDLSEHGELVRQARIYAERFGLRHEIRSVEAISAWDCYWPGDWDQALGFANRFLGEVEAGSPHYWAVECRILRGRIRLAQADTTEALTDAEIALASARGTGDWEELEPALAFHAHATLIATPDASRASARELLERLNPNHLRVLSSVLPDLTAAVHNQPSERDRLLTLIEQTDPTTPWLRAADATLRSDFQHAATIYAEIPSLPDEANARLLAARQAAENGRLSDAQAQAQAVVAFAEKSDAKLYQHRAEALLKASA